MQRAALEELLAVGLGGLADDAQQQLVDPAGDFGVEGRQQLALGERGAVENRLGEGGGSDPQPLRWLSDSISSACGSRASSGSWRRWATRSASSVNRGWRRLAPAVAAGGDGRPTLRRRRPELLRPT